MTFSFFKTVFVSIRFSFFVSELPLEIATRVPLLPQTLFGGMMREPKHAESPVITARKKSRATRVHGTEEDWNDRTRLHSLSV